MRVRTPYERSRWTATARHWFRAGGAVLLACGVVFTVIGGASFFGSFRSFPSGGPPKHFWCLFVGLPLVSIGIQLLRAGFLGAATEYVADEVAPTVSKAARHVVGEMPIDEVPHDTHRGPSASARLRRIESLRADGLISDQEYERKRSEILADL